MQRLRNVIDRVVTYTGVLLVMGTVIFTEASAPQMLLMLSGLLILQLGVWRVASKLLPREGTTHSAKKLISLSSW